MQGNWELVEIRSENGNMIYEVGKDAHCDVVDLRFESHEDVLTITAHDENGKEMKVNYKIKEDGRLVNMDREKPNMYILDLDANKVVLIDQVHDASGKGKERLLVFKKVD